MPSTRPDEQEAGQLKGVCALLYSALMYEAGCTSPGLVREINQLGLSMVCAGNQTMQPDLARDLYFARTLR
jgi:hypothetical protein